MDLLEEYLARPFLLVIRIIIIIIIAVVVVVVVVVVIVVVVKYDFRRRIFVFEEGTQNGSLKFISIMFKFPFLPDRE